ncbi:MAG: 16S rRNA (guanine(966)-N(2))-methyltransferase RsmD [Clostridiales bacterium]|nr:16S rRNA (guanine(966)-N(2))-methyltransferase RsmD [Clostridiales bacterium]
MRIITGIARGRRLREPEGYLIRPTTDKVKEAVFNIIQFDIEGRTVLDLFCGTGQLGIEALSRGAASCDFVDLTKEAVSLTKYNLNKSGLSGGQVIQTDALGFLSHSGKYDLIFLDPPYEKGLLEKAVERIALFDKLSVGGIIVCESPAGIELPKMVLPYVILREYKYGKTAITIYTKTDAEGTHI